MALGLIGQGVGKRRSDRPGLTVEPNNLTVQIDSVVYFQVTSPQAAVYEISNYIAAVEQLTITTLRNVVGGMTLEETLTSRDQINHQLRGVLDEAAYGGDRGVRADELSVQLRLLADDVRQRVVDHGREREALQSGRQCRRRRTDPQLHSDCIASFDQYEPLAASTSSPRTVASSMSSHRHEAHDIGSSASPRHYQSDYGR